MHPVDIPWPTLWRFHHYGSGDLENVSLFWETAESPIIPNYDYMDDEKESLHSKCSMRFTVLWQMCSQELLCENNATFKNGLLKSG